MAAIGIDAQVQADVDGAWVLQADLPASRREALEALLGASGLPPPVGDGLSLRFVALP